MSTSRGTLLSRLLSNKETVTIRVSPRTAVAAVGLAAFLGGALAGALLRPAAADLWRQFRERRDDAAALAPLIEQARQRDAGYDSAVPGDVVDWCIDHPSKGFSYLAGKQSQPILWADEAAAPITYGAKSDCQRMIARVVSREPQGLKLSFIGQP